MASEQFSLCWDNFHVNMRSGMHSLLEKEDLVDVTLAIEGQYLKAHKMVLSVCSPYFRKLFSTNPCKHPIFFMKDVTYEIMNNLLTFMYQGEVQVNQDNFATFIKTAEALQIKGLTGENREVDDALKVVNSLKRPSPCPDESKNRINRSKPNSAKKIKTSQDSQELQREESYIDQSSELIQIKVEPNELVEDMESYGWHDNSLNETENLPDDSQVDEAEEFHVMEEPKASTSLEGAIPNQDKVPPKRLSTSETDKKRCRKSLTLGTKLEVLRRIEAGEKIVEICKAMGLAKSTIQSIRDKKEDIKTYFQSAASLNVSRLTRQRNWIMEKMEKLLIIWIEDNNKQRIPMCQMTIQEKALSIFENLKNGDTNESAEDVTFQASRGWYEKFKNRFNLHNLKMRSEEASGDVAASKEYPIT